MNLDFNKGNFEFQMQRYFLPAQKSGILLTIVSYDGRWEANAEYSLK